LFAQILCALFQGDHFTRFLFQRGKQFGMLTNQLIEMPAKLRFFSYPNCARSFTAAVSKRS
jgi:hypothetical protein